VLNIFTLFLLEARPLADNSRNFIEDAAGFYAGRVLTTQILSDHILLYALR